MTTSPPRLEKLETLYKTVEFLDKWQEQTKKNTSINTFFHLVVEGKKTAAKTLLEKIKQMSERSQWHKGYINALEGMLVLSETSMDQNLLLHQIRSTNSTRLKKEFQQRSVSDLLNDFDRGFFAAWATYLQKYHLKLTLTKTS